MPIAEYIREQPSVIRRVFAEVPAQMTALAGVLPARPRAVALVGSGTSRHVLLALEIFLARRLGCPVVVIGPTAFMADPPAWASEGCLAVMLSQSGASTTTVEAVGLARARGMATLALTAEARSPLASIGGPLVIMPIGPEGVGPKTKGYTGSLAALMSLGLALGAEVDRGRVRAEAEAVADQLDTALAEWDAAAATLAERHAGAPHLMVLGQGRHLGTAHEAALKITEMSGIAAAAFDTEEALHGRFHALDATSPVFFIARAGSEQTVALGAASVLDALGIPHHVLRIDVEPTGDPLSVGLPPLVALPELDLLPAIVPLQCLARALALARGMAPEQMRYPGLSARLGIKLPAPADARRDGPPSTAP
jgi:glucosamine--fructose-6-phosphate aminotransferase (isomerizing)